MHYKTYFILFNKLHNDKKILELSVDFLLKKGNKSIS